MSTKAELETEIGALKHQIGELEAKIQLDKEQDTEIRKQLSGALDSYVYKPDGFMGGGMNREVEVMSWVEIAVAIGELKADANYAMVVESRDEFRSELNVMREFTKALERTVQNYRLGLDDPEKPLQGHEIPRV